MCSTYLVVHQRQFLSFSSIQTGVVRGEGRSRDQTYDKTSVSTSATLLPRPLLLHGSDLKGIR